MFPAFKFDSSRSTKTDPAFHAVHVAWVAGCMEVRRADGALEGVHVLAAARHLQPEAPQPRGQLVADLLHTLQDRAVDEVPLEPLRVVTVLGFLGLAGAF